jgi:hypothetical protein
MKPLADFVTKSKGWAPRRDDGCWLYAVTHWPTGSLEPTVTLVWATDANAAKASVPNVDLIGHPRVRRALNSER